MVKRYELSDEQWVKIAEQLPGKVGDPGRTAQNNRWCVMGIALRGALVRFTIAIREI